MSRAYSRCRSLRAYLPLGIMASDKDILIKWKEPFDSNSQWTSRFATACSTLALVFAIFLVLLF